MLKVIKINSQYFKEVRWLKDIPTSRWKPVWNTTHTLMCRWRSPPWCPGSWSWLAPPELENSWTMNARIGWIQSCLGCPTPRVPYRAPGGEGSLPFCFFCFPQADPMGGCSRSASPPCPLEVVVRPLPSEPPWPPLTCHLSWLQGIQLVHLWITPKNICMCSCWISRVWNGSWLRVLTLRFTGRTKCTQHRGVLIIFLLP